MIVFKPSANVRSARDSQNDRTILARRYQPGDLADRHGLYRCEGCGLEWPVKQGEPFPPRDHHRHSSIQRDILWVPCAFVDKRPGRPVRQLRFAFMTLRIRDLRVTS